MLPFFENNVMMNKILGSVTMINIQSDSRKIKPGDIFVAVKCEVNDGHQYIQDAIARGAAKVVVEQAGNYDVETVVVKNTRVYLNEYLKSHYNQYIEQMHLIGITGTNGKTTTAVLLHDALNLLGEKTAYLGTVGFYIKDKIANLPNTTVDICNIYDMLMQAYEVGCKNVVMEISSHALENGRCETLYFQYALFTNLTQDHLDEHGTMENYAYAKQKLFRQLKSDGLAILNSDDSYYHYFALKENHNITFGFQNANYQIISYNMSHIGTDFTYQVNQKNYKIRTILLGHYNLYNILGVIVLLHLMGISHETIKEIVPQLKPPVGRMDTIQYKSNSIIIDYAHTPDAFANIFQTVKSFQNGNIYTVFGCTGDRDRLKRPIMTQMVAQNSTYFIITNDDPHFEDTNQIVQDMISGLDATNYEICLNRRLAIRKGIDLLHKNDILLLLGKGHEEFMMIQKDAVPFNDKREVLMYLEQK